ncbi:MAG: efflux RND transporter permease subunit [Thermoanaerobaculia bacterium]
MKGPIALFVRRPVFTTVIILSLSVVGLFAYGTLGVDRFPQIEFPMVNVTTALVGAAPEEMETEVTDKIEEAVNTISGIDQLISASSEGISTVNILFDLGKDPDVAAQEVRDKLATIRRNLPAGIEEPIVQKLDPDAAPILIISLTSPTASRRDLTEYADKTLRRQLETVLGVGQVSVVGGREREIHVLVDSSRLSAYGITVAEIIGALASQNIQIPGGLVEENVRELSLRTFGRVERPEEIEQIPVATRGGQPIRLKDVARVADTVAFEESRATIDGKPAVALLIRKQSGTNTIAVAESVKERLSEVTRALPKGWVVDTVRDQSDFIVAAVHTVQEHLILGAIFASFIVWLFLRHMRPTLIAAVAIPVSLIATFAFMQWLGFTLNVITLLALTLAVGIVIDDAVVVLENIFRFLEEKKLTPRKAAVEGTKEVGLAVMATSLSLIAVFLPVAFMGGIVGRFMNSFGMTMSFAIAVSLLVSFTLTPMMSSRWLKKTDLEADEGSRHRGLYPRIERGYLRLLEWSLHHRKTIVVALVLVVLSTIPLFMAVNKNFLPEDDESQFTVSVRAPEGTSLEATWKIAESISARVRTLSGVRNTLVVVGSDPQRTRNLSSVFVQLQPPEDRDEDQFEIMDRIRREILPAYQPLGLRTAVQPVPAISGAGSTAAIQFWIGGPDLRKLEEYSRTLLERIRKVPGVVDADTNLISGKPELGVRIDRAKAADLGVRVQDIASTLNALVGGMEVSSYYENNEQYEVRVRAELDFRRDAESILQARVPSTKLGSVSLRDVVTIVEGETPAVINRIARRRQVLVTANLLPGYSSQTVIDELNRGAEALKMPSGYSYGLTGQSREQGKAAVNFGLAFLLSIIFMYLILAAQFESWIDPITILSSLPMTVPFALLSLLIFNQSVNIFSALGLLVLFGIVKKNGILQVDHTKQLRREGMERHEAVMHANRDRFRPILMTTLAFVAGMVPLVVSSGTGAGTNRAIGTVIMGGQTLALLLTLIGVPVIYTLLDDLAQHPIWTRLGLRSSTPEDPDEEGAGIPEPA